MKVGIVTEPLVDNYGGILQNYALQQVLRRLGHEPITLNYLPSLPFWRYFLYFVKNATQNIVSSKRKAIKRYNHFIERPGHFRRFVSENIAVTEPLERYTSRVLRKYGIEALVVGSDQVWRREYNPFLEDMYLAFAESSSIPKIAYAASFGKEELSYTEEQLKEARRLIKQFDVVSVRELSGRKICEESFGVSPAFVLDPTLLLDKEDYMKLCQEIPVSEEPYILAYVLDKTAEIKDTIDERSKSLEMPVKYVTVSKESQCSVEEWLALFRDAGYVITDSFHGTVFSIIFGKEVDCKYNENRGSDRMRTLFSEILSCEDPEMSLQIKKQFSLAFIKKYLHYE